MPINPMPWGKLTFSPPVFHICLPRVRRKVKKRRRWLDLLRLQKMAAEFATYWGLMVINI